MMTTEHYFQNYHNTLHGNITIQIFVDPSTPLTPWVLRYFDPVSSTGFNEKRYESVTIKTACRTVVRDIEANKGKYVLETTGTIYDHPTKPKATIQSNSLPRPY